MHLVKAPNEVRTLTPPRHKIFLAGSIEMGKAEKWQQKVAAALQDIPNIIVYDPRRDDWDSSWVQDPTPGTKFNEQVTWELAKIDESDIIAFYFDPNTQSPITLMELGVCLAMRKKMIVCCPDGYFRKGNVVITCRKFGVNVIGEFDAFLSEVGAAAFL